MSEGSESSLEIDQIETSALGPEKVVVRIVGRWRGRRRASDERAFLVVESDGRRHRFPAMPEPRRSRFGRPGQWGASFAVPAWLEPRLGREMSLWVGNSAVALPTLGSEGAEQPVESSSETADPGEAAAVAVAEDSRPAEVPASDPAAPETLPEVAPEAAPQPASEPAPESTADDEPAVEAQPAAAEPEMKSQGDAKRGPGAKREAGPKPPRAARSVAADSTVTALRAELKERAASEARLRGELAGSRAELQVRATRQDELEATQGELRAELEKLAKLVEQEGSRRADVESRAVVLAAEVADLQAQVADLQSQVGDLESGREQAIAELTEARTAAERERSGRAAAEERCAALETDLELVRAELAHSLVAHEAADGEAAGLRSELERLGAELAAVRGLADSGTGLADAQSLLEEARALSSRLRERGAEASEG
jgi:hypothetical protein